MRQEFDRYYLRNGVRRVTELVKPRLRSLMDFEYPFSTIVQFWPINEASLGPDEHTPFLNEGIPIKLIEHVTEYTHPPQKGRRSSIQPMGLVQDYRRHHREYKPLFQDKALEANKRNVLVENYGFLRSLYKYQSNFRSRYWRWMDIATTMIDRMNNLNERFPNHHQFISINADKPILGRRELRRFNTGLTGEALSLIRDDNDFLTYHLWLWIGGEREKSIFSNLTEATIKKVCLLVYNDARYSLVTLERLDRFRKDPEDSTSRGDKPALLWRKFARFYQVLYSGITEDEQDDTGDDDQITTQQSSAPAKSETRRQRVDRETEFELDDIPDMEFDTDEMDQSELPDPVDAPELPDDALKDATPTVQPEDDTIEDDDDGEEEEADDSVKSPESLYEKGPAGGVIRRAKELYAAGEISKRVYTSAIEDAKNFQSIKDPFGSGQSIGDAMVVSQEDLVLPDEAIAPDRDSIFDKSMLKAKTRHFRNHYNEKVLPKDILGAIASVQNQGVVVKNVQRTRVEDNMNRYDELSVTVKPIAGRQSIIKMRVPVLDEDGTFLKNGNKSSLRLQRIDLPIRKISPTSVSLTSYYKKLFVTRSERKVNQYDQWLNSQIKAIADDPENNGNITYKAESTFRKEWKVPYLYSLLSHDFSHITIKTKRAQLNLFLNYAHQKELFSEEELSHQTDAMTLIGRHGRSLVAMDNSSRLYEMVEGDWRELPRLQELLGVDERQAPLPMADVKVLDKKIPLVIVLGYIFGLQNLVDKLNTRVRRVPTSQRVTLAQNEFRVRFNDEHWVFDRRDEKATLIFSGLDRVSSSLSQYSVFTFNEKEIYYRIMDDLGLGVRYPREIDNLLLSWMDPITKGILSDMGEPTELPLLYIRAVELLLTQYSPDETDPQYMRYRGAERFAGAVYNAIHLAAKNQRQSNGNNPITLDPLEVWRNTTEDPSVLLSKQANPIQSMREDEGMTYRGMGGRTDRSMVKRTRVYHENDMGSVSESSVDSGAVGVIGYMAPDADFANARGITRRYNPDTDGNSSIWSSASLNAPFADHDD